MRHELALSLASALALVVTASALEARAHSMRTAYLELAEQSPLVFMGSWRSPTLDPHLNPHLPEACEVRASDQTGQFVQSFALHCSTRLTGQTLSVEGLGPLATEAVVRIGLLNGTAVSAVLTPESPSWTIPAGSSIIETAEEYVRLGILHILGGVDHLFFLLVLVLYVRRARSLLTTVTAFTAAHSITLCLTALGSLRVSSLAAEACIALTLVLLASKVHAGHSSRGHGPAVAFLFGLVHGLGFAGALAEIGLPSDAVPLSLAAFNVGVEIGQLGFVLAVVTLFGLLERSSHHRRIAFATTYLVGGTGMYWFIARSSALVPW